MARSLRHYHMGCGENLLSSSWLVLTHKSMQVNAKNTDGRLFSKSRQKKKS